MRAEGPMDLSAVTVAPAQCIGYSLGILGGAEVRQRLNRTLIEINSCSPCVSLLEERPTFSVNIQGNRASDLITPLTVINRIALTIGLLFIFPACALSQDSDPSGKSANELAHSVLQNEAKAEANDHSHWAFKLETEKSGRKEVDEVVETKNGDLKRPVSINGRALTAKEERGADEQIRRLEHDPNALRKSLKEQNDDAAQSQRLLKMMPEAFNFRFGERRGDAVQLHFTPNRHFRPTTREARVFQSMEGDLWVDSKQSRLMEINGHLTREVKFGGGVLGHLNAGGQFQVKQTEVAHGYWELTLLNVNMRGKALFFKTIGVQQKLQRSDFHQISDDLTLAQAADLLRKQAPVAVKTGQQ